jgi:serine/threonine protein kinase/tetratricopeptide (TPR) repeat protein
LTHWIVRDATRRDARRVNKGRSLPPAVGRFLVREELGRGGMGVVYRAHDPKLGREVAIKVLLNTDPELLLRFQREAQLASRLRHPGIVPVLEVGQHAGRPFLVLEFCAGQDLRYLLRERGAMETPQACAMVAEIARAVASAHDHGVLHRDLKPANIILEGSQPRVTDFGLARRREGSGSLTATGVILGTPAYMAPEQLIDARGVDVRADVYALGVILYELLSGRRPFVGATPLAVASAVLEGAALPLTQAAPHVPAGVVEVCRRAMAVDPGERYLSAGALADALEEAPASAAEARPSRWLLPVVVAIPLALVAGIGSVVFFDVLETSGSSLPPSTAPSPGALPSATPSAAPSTAPSPGALPSATPSAAPEATLSESAREAARLLRVATDAGGVRSALAPLRPWIFRDLAAATRALAIALPEWTPEKREEAILSSTTPPPLDGKGPLPRDWAAAIAALPVGERGRAEDCVRLARVGAPWNGLQRLLRKALPSSGLRHLILRLAIARGWGARAADLAEGLPSSPELILRAAQIHDLFGAPERSRGLLESVVRAGGPLGDLAALLLDPDNPQALEAVGRHGLSEGVAFEVEQLAGRPTIERLKRADDLAKRVGYLHVDLTLARFSAWLEWAVRARVPKKFIALRVDTSLMKLAGMRVPLRIAELLAKFREVPYLRARSALALTRLLAISRGHPVARALLGRQAFAVGEREVACHALSQGVPAQDVEGVLGPALTGKATSLRLWWAGRHEAVRRVTSSGFHPLQHIERTLELAAGEADKAGRWQIQQELLDTYLRRGEYEKLEAFASRLPPERARSAFVLSRLLYVAYRLGKEDLALERLELVRSVRDSPMQPVLDALEAVLDASVDLDRAFTRVRRAATLPDLVPRILLLDLHHRRQTQSAAFARNQPQRLETILLTLCTVPRDSVQRMVFEARATFQLGLRVDALQLLEQGAQLGLGREDPAFWSLLAQIILAQGGDRRRAAALLRKALVALPGDEKLRVMLAVAVGPNDPAAAAGYIRDLVQLNPVGISKALVQYGAKPWIGRTLELALALPPPPPRDAPLPAAWNTRLGRIPAPARADFERALRTARDPGAPWSAVVVHLDRAAQKLKEPSALLQLARARLATGRGAVRDALATLGRPPLATTSGLRGNVQLLRGRCRLLQGRMREGLAHLERAMKFPRPVSTQARLIGLGWTSASGPGDQADWEAWQDEPGVVGLAFSVFGDPKHLFRRVDHKLATWGALEEELLLVRSARLSASLGFGWPRRPVVRALVAGLPWTLEVPHRHARIAWVFLSAGEVDLARGFLDVGAKLDPGHVLILEGRGALAGALGKPLQALELWARALKGGIGKVDDVMQGHFRQTYPEHWGKLQALHKKEGE